MAKKFKKPKEQKPKEVVFSEEIDSALNGFAIGITFIGVGTFLFLNPDYFSISVVSYILGAFIGVIGVIGTGIELSKQAKVKGLSYLITGVVLLGLWLLGYIGVHSILLNIPIFFFLIFGCYALCLGLLQGVVSIVRNVKASKQQKNESKGKVIGSAVTQIILFLTQLCGLLLAVLNVLKAIPQQ